MKLHRRQCQPEKASLRLSPTAWAKLLFLRDAGDTEVGGFGITRAEDLLYVEDVQLVRQVCTGVSVLFDDQAVADYFDRQVDAGRRPEQVGRIWVHTHPGSCALPSSTDEDTFSRVFGRTDWAVLFILARDGQSYGRLQFHVGPGGSMVLPVEVDYRRAFAGSDQDAWQAEYEANVQAEELFPRETDGLRRAPSAMGPDIGTERDFWDDTLEEILSDLRRGDRERRFSDDHR